LKSYPTTFKDWKALQGCPNIVKRVSIHLEIIIMSTRSFFESRNTSMTVYRFVQWLLHLFTRERGGWREAGEEGEEREKRGREKVDVSYVHSYTFIYI